MTITIPSIPAKALELYVISGLVMAAFTFGFAFALLPGPTAATPALAAVDKDASQPFRVVPASDSAPKPLEAPPTKAKIQAVSFHPNSQPNSTDRAPWWTSSGLPRVPSITQFDGGPLQNVNCVMAAGAMLARLGYGIITTGTELRAHQSDQSGGTTLQDLDAAVSDGWGVHFARGYVSVLTFRQLLYGGAGAVIIVHYGGLPVGDRNQPSFTGDHAMYIDAFAPSNGTDGARYYVLDPIGKPWQGYNGQWVNAADLEHAALVFGGGGIVASWAYAGGTAPRGPSPTLPPEAVPSGAPSAEPSAQPSPSPSGSPSVDTPIGDSPAPEVPAGIDTILVDTSTVGGVKVSSILGLCVGGAAPLFCPDGIVGTYPSPSIPPSIPPLVPEVPLHLLYGSDPQPGTYQAIFTAPPGVTPELDYWSGGDPTKIGHADLIEATLDGQPVWIATFPVQPGTYHFLASAGGPGGIGVSDVGTTTIGH